MIEKQIRKIEVQDKSGQVYVVTAYEILNPLNTQTDTYRVCVSNGTEQIASHQFNDAPGDTAHLETLINTAVRKITNF